MTNREVVIIAAKRTPIGSYQGVLSSLSAPQLGVIAAKAAFEQAGISPGDIDEAYVGTVLPAGVGQAPARQVAIGAGCPDSVPCTTVNKVCGSGLKTVMLGASAIRLGECEVVLAGGMESMSNTPYYVQGARDGFRMGDKTLVDGMIKDGLWDVYNDYHMGNAAELCASECSVPREAQDAFATESYRRAIEAEKKGLFKSEIAPVEVPQRRGDPLVVDKDEEPGRGAPEKFAKLRPAFKKDGTVTAANASSLNDGASMLVLAEKSWAEARGIKPLARIVGYGSAAQAPEWFTTAPAKAAERTLKSLEMNIGDIDLFEINEAFSVVAIANENKLGLDRRKVNINGGAVALGHPIGASGARILTTLLYALEQENKKTGLASLCIGGGEAVAMVVERV